jgi:hypothetical protein
MSQQKGSCGIAADIFWGEVKTMRVNEKRVTGYNI